VAPLSVQRWCLSSAACQSFYAPSGLVAPRRTSIGNARSWERVCGGAQIERIRGMRCWVKGSIRDPAGALLATCEAQLADLQQLWKAQA